MSGLRSTIPFLILSFLSVGFGATTNDLASQDQTIRDAAAKVIRANWIAPARTNWDSLLATIKDGTPRTNILERLRQIQATGGGLGGGGHRVSERYRLDDMWNLECYYREGGSYPLLGKALIEQVRSVWVPPPTNFSGIWTTYWINGQRENEIHCTNGRYQGTFTGFYSDGKKGFVQHFENGRTEGEDTGYFPSGHLMYRGVYRNGNQSGAWVWYNDDGTTNSVRDYSKP
jgi:hypothetical protein